MCVGLPHQAVGWVQGICSGSELAGSTPDPSPLGLPAWHGSSATAALPLYVLSVWSPSCVNESCEKKATKGEHEERRNPKEYGTYVGNLF
jgi:hypothetical protein